MSVTWFTPPAEGLFLPPEKRDIGMVFQSYAIWPHMTVAQNVAYPLEIRKVSSPRSMTGWPKFSRWWGLTAEADKLATNLSGGQQQRASLARAIVSKPRLLLFDEPLSNLDLKLREQMRVELKRIQNEVGITSIYVTHDQSEALVMSDEIIVMSKGKIEQRGGPLEIYSRPVNEYVSNFIGVANLLKAKVRDSEWFRSGRRGSDSQDGQTMTVPCQIGPGIGAGDDAVLSVRPENVHAVREGNGNDDVEGEVTHAIFLGNYVDCRVKWGDFEWKVIAHPRARLKAGEKVFLQFDPEHTLAVQP